MEAVGPDLIAHAAGAGEVLDKAEKGTAAARAVSGSGWAGAREWRQREEEEARYCYNDYTSRGAAARSHSDDGLSYREHRQRVVEAELLNKSMNVLSSCFSCFDSLLIELIASCREN